MEYHNMQMKREKPKKETLEISTGTLRKILYIGELPPNTDQYFLYQLIMAKGSFSIDSITTKNTKDNKSYAYVKFSNEREALKAKEILHLENVNGYVIRTNIFNKHLEKSDSSIGNLVIKHHPSELTSKELYDIFQEIGPISSISLNQGSKGECLGQGYVQFANENDAEKAIEKLKGFELKGRKILIEKFDKNKNKKESEEKTTIIFFQQLPVSIQKEADLEKILSEFGKVLFLSLFQNKSTNSNNALIVFEKQSEAKSCLMKLNNSSPFDGDLPFRLTLNPTKEEIDSFSKSKNENFKKKYENCNLIVKNLPKEMNDTELFTIFREFGEISKAIISTEGKFVTKRDENGEIIDKEYIYESKGFGFVCFKKAESAESAISGLNGKPLTGKYQDTKLVVEYYNYDRSNENKQKNVNSHNKNNNQQNYNNNHQGGNNNYHNNNNNNYKGKKKFVKKPHNPMGYNQENNQKYYSNPNNFNQNMKPYPQQQQMQNYPQNMQYFQQNRAFPQPQYQQNVQQVPQRQENPFVYELMKVVQSKDENKREILGEQIFYYLKNLLANTKLNNTKVDDDRLCARFTGIFLNSSQIDLIEIFRFEETLIKTLKEIIFELLKDPGFTEEN